MGDPCTLSFFLLGLINNSGYVVMIAGAKNISEGSVALVFLCNVLPSLLCKLTGPLWFHKVNYDTRMNACMILLSVSLFIVAFTSTLAWKLIGVCFVSLQSGMGEASLLALSSRYPSPPRCLTAWSAGTGFAGVFGFAFVYALKPLGFKVTLLSANVLVAVFAAVYYVMLPRPLMTPTPVELLLGLKKNDGDGDESVGDLGGIDIDIGSGSSSGSEGNGSHASGSLRREIEGGEEGESGFQAEVEVEEDDDDGNLLLSDAKSPEVARARSPMSARDRCLFTTKLRKYMAPLFLVYFAEYCLQSGVWASIGFPVQDESSRRSFYTSANWLYQLGVFLSRSSGTIYKPSLKTVQAMPVLQCVLLVFFYNVAWHATLFYGRSLLILCFVVGILGGLVYVNIFNIISREVESSKVELSLATVSVADSFGVMLSDICGLWLQACLYEHHGISGAKVSCGL